MNNPLKYADPSGYQWMKKMAFQLYSNGEDSYSGMGSWGGGGAPSNTPHIDRMQQESMNQDASGGWRWDETTGTYDNIFSGERGSNDEVYNNYIVPNTVPLTAENLDRNHVCTVSSQYVSYRTGANGAITGAQISYTPTNVQLVFFEMGDKTYSTYIRSGNGLSRSAVSGQGGEWLDNINLGSAILEPIGAGARNILDNRGAYMAPGEIYSMNMGITVRTPFCGINTTSKILNYSRIAGKVAAFAGIATTGIQVVNDVRNRNYATAGARTTVYGLAAGVAFVPVVGWGLSVGIGVADYVWGDQLYEYLSTNKQ